MTFYKTKLKIFLLRYYRYWKLRKYKKGLKKNMNLKIYRMYFKASYTIGRLYLNEQYICDVLEDTYRDLAKQKKIMNKTAIPFGTYNIIFTYSPKFNQILPELLDVPYFTNIRIHAGNTNEDTSGCILVGENKIKGGLVNSKNNLNKLLGLLNYNNDVKLIIC